MAVEAGVDHVFANNVTWIFESGVGKAFVVITRRSLCVFPCRTVAGAGNTSTRTTTTIGGRPPNEAAQALLEDPTTTPESLDATLAQWCDELPDAILRPLDSYLRIKLRGGWFNRSLRMSQTASGFDSGFGTAVAFRPTKAEFATFERFFAGDARLS